MKRENKKTRTLFLALAVLLFFSSGVQAISQSINVDVISTRNFTLTFLAIDNPNNFQETIDESVDFIQKTFPLSEGGVKYEKMENFNSDVSPFVCSLSDVVAEICMINLYLKAGKFVVLGGGFPERIVGVAPQNWFSDNLDYGSRVGHARPPFKTVLVEENYKSNVAHELGHTYGFCEEYSSYDWSEQDEYFNIISLFNHGCKNGDFNPEDGQLDAFCFDNSTGCDTSTIGKLIPWNGSDDFIDLYNFMGSITDQENRWISGDSYLSLLEEFSHSTPENVSDRIVVGGTFNKSDGSYDLTTFYSLGPGLAENRSDFTEGNFSIKFKDASNNTIYDINFSLAFKKFNEGENSTESNISGFVFVLPFYDNVSSIIFKENNITKDQINRTLNTPTLNITSNLSGKVFYNELFNVSWNASDVDGGELAYAILFSDNNGSNYTTLEIDYNQTTLILNTSTLPSCQFCRIKILVTDGINTNSSVSDAFNNGALLDIHSLTQLYSTASTERTFGFFITNLNSTTMNNVTWKFNTGTQNITSQFTSNLSAGDSKYVVFEYNYSAPGTYNIIATAFGGDGSISDSETMQVTV